jgi:hypothetical protein
MGYPDEPSFSLDWGPLEPFYYSTVDHNVPFESDTVFKI